MHYYEKNPSLKKEGVWDEKSCVRRIGGFDLDKSNLPADMKHILKGSVMAFNKETGFVSLIKTVKVYEEAAQSATSVKVEKGSAVKVGDKIGGSTVSAVDTTNADYDVLTISALSKKATVGTVLADANEANAIGLVYDSRAIDDFTSVTVTLQAYEIQEETLPYPVNDAIKTALTVRHAWKL